jgi:hypothetical protein
MQEQLTCGTITFNATYPNNLDEALDSFRLLKQSCDAGWNAFYKVDYELQAFKDYIGTKAPNLLKQWELKNGKEILRSNRRGNRKAGKKVRGSK